MKSQITGNIFDIQRYSIHDGPGIRTTVFLKGCPMRCKWCANPESWSAQPQLFFSAVRCIKCGSCSAFDGITMSESGPVIDRGICRNLSEIADVCPSGALTVKGKNMTVDEVFEEIKKDLPFYEKSGGGVSISGGEALLQPEFVLELLKLCRNNGIHTVIETCGNVPWEHLEQVIPFTNQFYFDVKLVKEELHKAYTGCSNQLILHNLKQLVQHHENVWVRTPLIPGINDSEEELKAIAELLKQNHISGYELLAFHQYGKGKYASCGMAYELDDLEQMSEERKRELEQIFEKFL